MKKLMILFGLIIILGFTTNAIRAEASSDEQQNGLYMVTPDVPTEITTFAKSVVDEQIAVLMTGNTNDDIYINNYSLLSMGSGFYAFNRTTGEAITNITYFPIFEADRYVLTLIIVNENGTLSHFIGNDFDEGFQNVPSNTYDHPYALLYDGNKASYLLTDSGQTLFQGIPEESITTFSAPISLQTLLPNNQIKDISQEQLDINEQDIVSSNTPTPMAINPQGFSVNTSTTKRLQMSNCLLLQYGDPICWAAALGIGHCVSVSNWKSDSFCQKYL